MLRISKLFRGGSAAVLAFTMTMQTTPARADNTPECDAGLGTRNTDCGVNALTSFAGTNNTAVGAEAETIDQDSVFGTINNVTAIGAQSKVFKDSGTALGANAQAEAANAEALGAGATASAANATALGQGSVADQAFTVSIGRSDLQRRIVNVADGIDDNDAVSVRQLNNALGNAPDILDEAKAYTDTRETSIRADMAAGDAATLTAANGYTDTRETLIRDDIAAGDAATLAEARDYADAGDARIEGLANTAQTTANNAQAAANNAQTTANTALANGKYFRANGSGAVPQATGADAIGIGTDSIAGGDQSAAMGAGAQALGDSAVALGNGASATAENSVALGSGSVADEVDTVSVGTATATRRIVNVSAGVAPMDAVNMSQLTALTNNVNAIGGRVDILESRVGQHDFDIRRIDRMASRGVAIATALASVPALDGDKKFGIGFGTGTYDGRVAFSLALIARAGDSAQFRVNAGTAGNGKIAAGAGATIGF